MLAPNRTIVDSGEAVDLSSDRATDYAVGVLEQVAKEGKDAKKAHEEQYIANQEQLDEMLGQANANDMEGIDTTNLETKEWLSDAYNDNIDMNSPKFRREWARRIGELERDIVHSQKSGELLNNAYSASQEMDYVNKDAINADIAKQARTPLGERNYQILDDIRTGDKYYNMEAEVADLATQMERTNTIDLYDGDDPDNFLIKEFRSGFKYNKETQDYMLSEEYINSIVSGERGSQRLQNRLQKEADLMVADAQSKGIDMGPADAKIEIIENMFAGRAGAIDSVKSKKTPAVRRETRDEEDIRLGKEDIKNYGIGFGNRDNIALAPYKGGTSNKLPVKGMKFGRLPAEAGENAGKFGVIWYTQKRASSVKNWEVVEFMPYDARSREGAVVEMNTRFPVRKGSGAIQYEPNKVEEGEKESVWEN